MNKPAWQYGGGQGVFQYLGRLFDLKTFIETGLGTGAMISFMHPAYEEIYSIETDPFHFETGENLFQFNPRIHLIFGSSAVELPKLLERLPHSKTFFWLDAHGELGNGGPIQNEIDAVMKYRPDALIAVDDVGPGQHHRVDFFNQFELKTDYRFNRVMFLHDGRYDIPDLEEYEWHLSPGRRSSNENR